VEIDEKKEKRKKYGFSEREKNAAHKGFLKIQRRVDQK